MHIILYCSSLLTQESTQVIAEGFICKKILNILTLEIELLQKDEEIKN